jgi:hypothetical protein
MADLMPYAAEADHFRQVFHLLDTQRDSWCTAPGIVHGKEMLIEPIRSYAHSTRLLDKKGIHLRSSLKEIKIDDQNGMWF